MKNKCSFILGLILLTIFVYKSPIYAEAESILDIDVKVNYSTRVVEVS